MRIGIIGDGQLGRMLAMAGQQMGHEMLILGPTPNSPAGQVAQQVLGDFRNPQDVAMFGSQVEMVTFEFEDASADGLQAILDQGIPVLPSPSILTQIKDKYVQKQFLHLLGIPTTHFRPVDTAKDVCLAGEDWSYPVLLKARHGSYDGKGNAVVKSTEEVETAMQSLGNRTLYAEAYVPFIHELAVVGARNHQGEIALYEIVRTVQDHGVCHLVYAGLPLPQLVVEQAKAFARRILDGLDYVGTMGIEFFQGPGGEVLVNELAPRVHNSGHWTMDGAATSQFTLHLQAILDEPLGSTARTHQTTVMTNLLGQGDGPAVLHVGESVPDLTGMHVHWYGKSAQTLRRKLGHINVTGPDLATVVRRTELALSQLTW